MLEIEAKRLSISLQFETQFDPYTTYCMEEANCLKYFKEKLVESEDFKTYITVRSLQAVLFHCGSIHYVLALKMISSLYCAVSEPHVNKHYKRLTRWNANRCYSLRIKYLIFETFQTLFPTASLIFTAV